MSIDLSLILDMLLISFLSSLMGYLTIRILRLKIPSYMNLPSMLPIYFTFGLSSLILILMVLSLIYVDSIVFLGLYISLIILFFYINRKSINQYSIDFSSLSKISFLLPLIILVLSFVRFVYLALSLGWAPYLDPASHGKYVGLILYHHRIPSSTYPIGNLSLSPLKYPMGFHVLSASISSITGLYPGQVILAVATMIVTFLPSLLYSIIYISTRSIKLSSIAYLLAYFLPEGKVLQWQPSHDLLLGNFLPGTYPNLTGNIIFLSFFAVILGFDKDSDYCFKKIFGFYLLIMLSLAFIYYPLLSFALLFIFLRILIRRINKCGISILRLAEIFAIFSLLIGSWGLISIFRDNIFKDLNVDVSFFYKIYMRYPLFTSTQYIFYIISILIAVLISIWFLFRSKYIELSIMFLILFFPLMMAKNEYIYTNFLWFIQPDRVLILLVSSSYIVNLMAISEIFKLKIKMKIKLKIKTKIITWEIGKILLVFGVAIFFTLSLIGHISYSYPLDFQDTLPHGNDFEVMKWILENTNATDLVLNDLAVIATWIPTFGAHDLVNERDILRELYLFHTINGTWLANRTIECNNILFRPWDYNLTKEMANKYNLKYIYISEGDPRIPMAARRQSYSPPFPWKDFNQEERIKFYLLNPNLEVVYRSGNSIVFKIIH